MPVVQDPHHPQPRRASYLADAAGRASAWAGSGAGMDADVAGTAPRAAPLSCASSLAVSARKVGGTPSSSTSVTVLPMVNQSFIWSTVSLRSIVTAPFQRCLNGRQSSGNCQRRERDVTARRGRGRTPPAPSPPIRARQRPRQGPCASGPALALGLSGARPSFPHAEA